jgi:hypothetical protein
MRRDPAARITRFGVVRKMLSQPVDFEAVPEKGLCMPRCSGIFDGAGVLSIERGRIS